MTDNTSNIGGNRAPGQRETAILEEGDVTISTDIDGTGRERTVYPRTSPLSQGDPVAIVNSSENTFAATEGKILVEKPQNGEGLVIGQIFDTPTALYNKPATAAAADSLTERLSGKYHRRAAVEIWIPGVIKKITIACNGTNAVVPGVGTTIELDLAKSYAAHKPIYTEASSGGTGIIPLHYVPAGNSGDLYNILAIFTGLQTAVTGS